MAFNTNLNLLSTQQVMQALEEEAADRAAGIVKATTASSGSLSSSTSKGVSSSSTKMEGQGRKRKASEQTPKFPTCDKSVITEPCIKIPEPIIRRISADRAHFKEVVHQFTGQPRPVPSPAQAGSSNLLAAAIAQSLQTLEIVAAHLLINGSNSVENNVLLKEIMKSKRLPFLQALRSEHQGLVMAGGGGVYSNLLKPSSTNGGPAFKSPAAVVDRPHQRREATNDGNVRLNSQRTAGMDQSFVL